MQNWIKFRTESTVSKQKNQEIQSFAYFTLQKYVTCKNVVSLLEENTNPLRLQKIMSISSSNTSWWASWNNCYITSLIITWAIRKWSFALILFWHFLFNFEKQCTSVAPRISYQNHVLSRVRKFMKCHNFAEAFGRMPTIDKTHCTLN